MAPILFSWPYPKPYSLQFSSAKKIAAKGAIARNLSRHGTWLLQNLKVSRSWTILQLLRAFVTLCVPVGKYVLRTILRVMVWTCLWGSAKASIHDNSPIESCSLAVPSFVSKTHCMSWLQLHQNSAKRQGRGNTSSWHDLPTKTLCRKSLHSAIVNLKLPHYMSSQGWSGLQEQG